MDKTQRYAVNLVHTYFDRVNNPVKNEEAPKELRNNHSETVNTIVKKLSLLDQTPTKEIKGLATDLKREGFALRSSIPANKKIEDLVLKMIETEYSTWNINGVTYTLKEYENKAANLYLIWPKGDGNRYQIMDLESFDEEGILNGIKILKFNGRNIGGSSFAYGKLVRAYKTQDQLAVLCFQYHHDR